MLLRLSCDLLTDGKGPGLDRNYPNKRIISFVSVGGGRREAADGQELWKKKELYCSGPGFSGARADSARICTRDRRRQKRHVYSTTKTHGSQKFAATFVSMLLYQGEKVIFSLRFLMLFCVPQATNVTFEECQCSKRER